MSLFRSYIDVEDMKQEAQLELLVSGKPARGYYREKKRAQRDYERKVYLEEIQGRGDGRSCKAARRHR